MNRLLRLSHKRSNASLVSTFNDESKLEPLKNPLDWKIIYKVLTSLNNSNNFSIVHNSFKADAKFESFSKHSSHSPISEKQISTHGGKCKLVCSKAIAIQKLNK